MFLLAVCFIDLDLCLRLFSCWKMKLLFIVLMETCRFYAKMFWYLALPMIASILTTAPVPAEENKTIKQLKSSVWSDHKIFRHMILAKFRLAKGFFFLVSNSFCLSTLHHRHVENTGCCCYMQQVTITFQTFRQLL